MTNSRVMKQRGQLMNCAALITAGGVGLRMGSQLPKQYIEIDGVPIIARTIAAFDTHPCISLIVVTVPAGDDSYFETNILGRYLFKKQVIVAQGGKTRQESVFNGLRELHSSELVAIHDGVRPFITQSVISGVIERAKLKGACIAALPVTETVKRKRQDVLETVPRDELWLAKTPQVFRTGLILAAHEEAARHDINVTDDAALLERIGSKVDIYEDSPFNIKITSKDDLVLGGILARLPEFNVVLRLKDNESANSGR